MQMVMMCRPLSSQ